MHGLPGHPHMTISGRLRREVRRQAPILDRAFSLGLALGFIILAAAGIAALSQPSTGCQADAAGYGSTTCGRRP